MSEGEHFRSPYLGEDFALAGSALPELVEIKIFEYFKVNHFDAL